MQFDIDDKLRNSCHYIQLHAQAFYISTNYPVPTYPFVETHPRSVSGDLANAGVLNPDKKVISLLSVYDVPSIENPFAPVYTIHALYTWYPNLLHSRRIFFIFRGNNFGDFRTLSFHICKMFKNCLRGIRQRETRPEQNKCYVMEK